MNSIIPEIPAAFYLASAPVLILSVASMVAMLQSVFSSVSGQKAISTTVYAGLLAALVSSLTSGTISFDSFLMGGFVHSAIGRMGTILMLSIAVIVAALMDSSNHKSRFFTGEMASLFLASVAGAIMMVSAGELISVFIGLEIASLTTYALAGYISPSRRSQEGAMKYLILGSFATAFMLFGMALVYGATGTMVFEEMTKAMSIAQSMSWAKLGVMMLVAGVGFKLALVPFHMWAPDVYESSPTALTAYMATAVKVMILVFALRISSTGFAAAFDTVSQTFIFLAAASVLIGNIMGLVQSSIKRMLAYSSIAHSGYMAIALASLRGAGMDFTTQSVMFYLAVYSGISLGAFAVICWLESKDCENIQLDDLAGLAKSHPWASFALATFMFSLAGLPPTAGFIAKLFVFQAALKAGLYGIIVIAVIGSSISLYYYLRVIVKMYMTEPRAGSPALGIEKGLVAGLVATASIVAVLLFGTVFAGCGLSYFDLKPAADLSSNSTQGTEVVASDSN